MARPNKINKYNRFSVCLLVDRNGDFTEITEDAFDTLVECHTTDHGRITLLANGPDGPIYNVFFNREKKEEVPTAVSGLVLFESLGVGVSNEAIFEIERVANWFVTFKFVFI